MNRPISPFSYAGKGFVSCKDGIVTISTTDLTENRAVAFYVADGKVEVATRNVKEERLKATVPVYPLYLSVLLIV